MNPINRFDRLDLFARDDGGFSGLGRPDEIDESTAANREREAADAQRQAQERRACTPRDTPLASALSSLAEGRLLDVSDS